ncbi:PREDICTED: zinc finger MYM-type 1, partial [Prunus dulcis]
MAVVFRYVYKSGDVIERFVGLQHVSDTTSNSLREVIDTLFSREELNISMLKGQGYDGASNMKVLKLIIEDGSTDNIGEANRSLRDIQSFEFVFCLFFMRSILGVTNDLSQALQRKDQDLGNAMTLVKDCKDQLQRMRENAFEALLDQVSSFCGKHDIEVPNMDDAYVAQWRSHRRAPRITHLHHYRVDIFIQIIEWQLAELNHRFSE